MTELDPKAFAAGPESKLIGLKAISSTALRRLIEEVRNTGDAKADVTAYNRTYHRHNR
ncbi:MAG: YhhA family cyclophane-containing RiPP [Brevundimonas sp.]|jgi:hypothetical protein|uniref:YhhA family cyclophane-containing RiPP n=1 Tax=Brevundimonas TaxID=41275 RepID=UPI0022ABCC2E|nr:MULTISPECIES: YhhA family cyclophane-containing RiPP [Brevundimonas]